MTLPPLVPPVGAAEVVDMATGTVAQAIEGGLSPEKMAALRAAANRQHEIATVRAQWIEGKTQEIASAIQQLTPFYSEQAAAALAQTEDVRAFVSDLLRGIESLDLYLGKDVEVQTVREGKGAPRDVPLTFVQRKLLADEELAVWADVDERFDHASRFEKRGILDEIAARCDGLRGRVEQVVEGIRGAVGRLEVAIEDLARKLAPRSARMTTKALKRDLAALERDYGEDDDRSPKARAAEAQRAARARDANRDDRPPQRSWSQSR